MLTTKEKILDYLLSGMLHLSKKDYSFFNNLKFIIESKKPITTNQNKLFDKLLLKYQRQFRKNNIEVDTLLSSKWTTPVVDSDPEFLKAKIYFEDEFICIRSPFNNNFINSLRKEHFSSFEWQKDKKIYRAIASTYNLKIAIELVNKHYNFVQLCPKLETIVGSLDVYKNCIWNPTLVKRNGIFYICAINHVLYNLVKDIELNNDPKTLFYLSSLDVKVDAEIVKDDEFLRFASAYNSIVDIDNIIKLAEWLKKLDVDFVYLARDLVYNKSLYKEVTGLLEGKIKYGPHISTEAKNIVKLGLSSHGPHRDSKLGISYRNIFLRNIRPISIS